jgi:hypothetical protein
VVSNLHDGLNRRITNGLASGSTWLVMLNNGYDAASRLAAVSDRTNLAQYAYLTNSALVGNITFSRNGASRMNTAKNYDYLDRLTNALSTPTGAGQPGLGLDYAYNAANQRSRATLADGSYWVYQYDNLGQGKPWGHILTFNNWIPSQRFA